MNFIQAVKEGQQGRNMGLPTGIPKIDRIIDGVQRKAIYVVGAAPKVGKSSYVLFSFIIHPYLHAIANNLKVKWIFYSLEMDRIKVEFRVAAFFFFHDYGIESFEHEGETYELSHRYLSGKQKDKDNKMVKLSDEHKAILNDIYTNRIIPMFGEYDLKGNKIKDGMIETIVDKSMSNPTGIRNYIWNYAKSCGQLKYEKFETEENGQKTIGSRIVAYEPDDPDEHVIIVIDHVRKMKTERSFQMKQNVDKLTEYQITMRNLFGYTFVDIIHMNRDLGNWEKLKFMSEVLYPNGDHTKDTGNLSEDCDFMLTLFNPTDPKYNIKKHFGMMVEKIKGYRSIHLVESRDTECPVHFQTIFKGNISHFKSIN